jgi:ferredoxin-NADP reductase
MPERFGRNICSKDSPRLLILRNGLEVHEVALADMKPETVIGRHPNADIQLEAQKLAMFHACLWKLDDEYYIESLDLDHGTLLNRKKLKPKYPVQLHDGAVVDLPGYQLLFTLPNWPPSAAVEAGVEEIAEIPPFFHTPSVAPPPPCPLLSNLVEAREHLGIWTEGITTLKVVNIIEETHDVKTFRLAGENPLLFSYQLGQFITLLLEIDGHEVQRSCSMSSSPSRPHTLELTVKRVPGGRVSNWFCDRVKLGDLLRVKGPAGKFTCFHYPSNKLLFIAAGSGLTPIMSMCRWIVDTAADVDVKLLASFRSPPEIIFRKELEWMSSRHSAFQVALTMTSGWRGTECWTGFTGRVSRPMISLLAPDYQDRHIFICGPEPFMENAKEILRELDFDLSKLHSESFGTGRVAQGTKKETPSLALSGPLHLDLAEAHGIEIDYGCRSGSCGECEVKCRDQVEMTPECEIDAQQRAAGFIYACTCVAKSDIELDA